jgi:hypothetical protein
MSFIAFSMSCSRTTPAGFWTDFHKDLISSKNSDQGPWGGLREISWKSETEAFSLAEVLSYSTEHDWTFVDSLTIAADSLTSRSLSSLSTDDYSTDILKDRILPKVKPNDKILVFKTTWLAVEPGNARETFENGFAIMNSPGTELKIFHLWGE